MQQQCTMSALAHGLQTAHHACSRHYTSVHCCLQEYALLLTDVLADLLARPAVLVSSDQHVTGYSRVALQSLLAQLPHGLLHDLMDIPGAQHCWLYFGQHVFPTCTQLFVCMARNYMCKAVRGDPSLTACPQLESFVHMLGDGHMHGCHIVTVCLRV